MMLLVAVIAAVRMAAKSDLEHLIERTNEVPVKNVGHRPR
jgi:hypothetical protein